MKTDYSMQIANLKELLKNSEHEKEEANRRSLEQEDKINLI